VDDRLLQICSQGSLLPFWEDLKLFVVPDQTEIITKLCHHDSIDQASQADENAKNTPKPSKSINIQHTHREASFWDNFDGSVSMTLLDAGLAQTRKESPQNT
jgi:hypothetical protein